VFEDVYVAADDVLPFQSAFERPTTVGPLAQILHAAIDTGIARAAYEDALHFVRSKTRPWIDSGNDKATEDPLTLKSFGHLSIRLHATEALLERAGEFLDAPKPNPMPRPSRPPRLPSPKHGRSAPKSPSPPAALCSNSPAARRP
jgi:alkylation response protein AidB-like acyl-CoA dehydrogenase